MTASLDIVIPVLNEERGLASSINKLHAFATSHLSQFKWTILIADNGSTDSTKQLCIDLSSDLSNVDYIYLKQRGRGRALKKAWLGSEADIMCYMDVDLSTDLAASSLISNSFFFQSNLFHFSQACLLYFSRLLIYSSQKHILVYLQDQLYNQ